MAFYSMDLIISIGFAGVAESLIDQAIELNAIGGVYGNQKPTHFMCLLLKLLQIQPEKEILVEYLQVDEFKYVLIPYRPCTLLFERFCVMFVGT